MTAATDGGGVIAIEPFIRRKRLGACEHHHVEVDDVAASLTCCDCGVALDPWTYLRWLARQDEIWTRRHDEEKKEMADMVAKHNAWIAEANQRITDYNAAVQHLVDVKNRLSNEVIGGERLGAMARRRRRRTP